MKSFWRTILIVVFLILNAVAALDAQVTLHACNSSSVPIRVAYISMDNCGICDDYTVHGWVAVKPQECTALLDHEGEIDLAIYAETEGGFFVRPNVRANAKCLFCSDNNSRIEYFHSLVDSRACVRRDASDFSYNVNKLDATSCGEEGMLANFVLAFRPNGTIQENQEDIEVHLNVDGAHNPNRTSASSPNQSPQPKPPPPSTTTAAADPTAPIAHEQEFVQEDVDEYIAAGKTNFEGLKSGNPYLQDGHRNWNTKSKPWAAQRCVITELPQTNSLSCLLTEYPNRQKLEAEYQRLVSEVKRATPGWSWRDTPYPKEIDSVVLKNADLRLEGEIFVHYDPDRKLYQLFYQIVRD